MNQDQAKAYDGLGRIQTYYLTHDPASGALWRSKGHSVDHFNGEDSACIWGAAIATGSGTKHSDGYGYRMPKLMRKALQQAAIALGIQRGAMGNAVVKDIAPRYVHIGRTNDAMIGIDKPQVRKWLAAARALIKNGEVI